MRLLFVIDSLGSGGAQRQMVTLGAGLVKRGHQVEIFTYHGADHFAHEAMCAGVAVRFEPKPSRFSLQPARRLRSLMGAGKYEGVLAFLETPSFYAELGRLGRRAPVLIVSERSAYSSANLTLRGRIQQEMHRVADWITVNSHHQRAEMIKLFPWMASRIGVVWNGVDVQHFAAKPLPRPREGVLRVQVLASLARNKNPLGLAKAIRRCRDDLGLSVEVNWAGVSKVSGDGDLARSETDEYLREAKLTEHWSWSGEIKDVRPLLEECDVVLLASHVEGLPNALCEALSCGRPILASDIGDHSLLVDGEANGFLFDPESPDDIAKALTRYARLDEVGRRAKAESARRFAENNLSSQGLVNAYENYFLRLMKPLQTPGLAK